MLLIFILGLLAHTALSLDIPCKDGEEIKAEPIDNIDYMIGNWSYIYHYTAPSAPLDELNAIVTKNFKAQFMQCPEVEIKPISGDVLDAKKAQCGEAPEKLKWEEAKLVINAPIVKLKDGLIFEGQHETRLMTECGKVLDIGPKKVSDSIMLTTDKVSNVVEMFSRKPIPYYDLECVAKNLGMAKGMSGLYMCV